MNSFFNVKSPSVKWVVFILSGIIFCSSLFMLSAISQDNLKYSRKDATGFKPHQATQFFYFYKNLSLFPLAVEKKELSKLKDSPADARSYIKKNPEDLRMEIKHWYRFGEAARIWALYPAYLLGEPLDNLSLKPLNIIVFSITALVLFLASYKLGGVTVATLGTSLFVSSPFVLSETFLIDNIFAIQPMLHIFAISLFVILHGGKKRYLLAATMFIAALSGLFSEIRGENITVLLVPVVYWLLALKCSIGQKVLVCLAVVLVFGSVKSLIRSHFNEAYARTYQIVDSVGGATFDGGKTGQHPIWHPLLAGLGDYGQDKGFLWSDREIFYRVLGKAGFSEKEIRDVGKTYYDSETQHYYKRPETLGNYSRLARNEFVSTVVADPLWYAGILVKRAFRIVTDVPPLTFYFSKKDSSQFLCYGGIVGWNWFSGARKTLLKNFQSA